MHYGPCKKSPSLSTRVQGPRTCTHATNPYPSADVGLSRQYFFASCAAPAASAAWAHSDSKHCTQYFSSSAFKVNIHSCKMAEQRYLTSSLKYAHLEICEAAQLIAFR